MQQKLYDDLAAFVAVGQERSFTRAAKKLGVTPSALSQTIRGLEERLGLSLLARTTRSVSPTALGERLLQTTSSRLGDIDAELASLHDLNSRPSGTIRITSSEAVADAVVWPKLENLLREHSEIQMEISSDASLTDIVADRYDAGVRLGGQVEKDMIAVRITPDMRMAVVGSPDYFANRSRPVRPPDLTGHDCINIRLPTSKSLSVWEFKKAGREYNVRVSGRLTFNSGKLRLRAALSGFGLAYMPEDQARPHIEAGKLVSVLNDWCAPFPGFHLYFPSRRQMSPAFALVVEALRHRHGA